MPLVENERQLLFWCTLVPPPPLPRSLFPNHKHPYIQGSALRPLPHLLRIFFSHQLSAGGSSPNNTSAPRAGPNASKRRRSSGGRRRSKGGSGGSIDFSFSPYQPMVIATTSGSVSPRPRRASAPMPPSSLLLNSKQSTGGVGERQGTDGPTLDQCLVLPAGLALEIDGLLTSAPAEVEVGRGSSSGGNSSAPQPAVSSDNRPEGGGTGERDKTGLGTGRGDDRAIISSYHFEVGSWNNFWFGAHYYMQRACADATAISKNRSVVECAGATCRGAFMWRYSPAFLVVCRLAGINSTLCPRNAGVRVVSSCLSSALGSSCVESFVSHNHCLLAAWSSTVTYLYRSQQLLSVSSSRWPTTTSPQLVRPIIHFTSK